MPAYRTNYATRGSYASRGANSETWARNRNVVRHNSRITLGPLTHTIVIGAIALLIGLIFLSQSAKVTSYDQAISNTNTEISNLEAQRDALKVENAKITAAAADEDYNEVAATMTTASSSDYVKE